MRRVARRSSSCNRGTGDQKREGKFFPVGMINVSNEVYTGQPCRSVCGIALEPGSNPKSEGSSPSSFAAIR